jgi:hypothetical protein
MGYKVEFEDNKAVRAILVQNEINKRKFIEFSDEKDKVIIKSLYVEAADEANAILQAQQVVKTIWGEVLGLK